MCPSLVSYALHYIRTAFKSLIFDILQGLIRTIDTLLHHNSTRRSLILMKNNLLKWYNLNIRLKFILIPIPY
jgi:hypothetical protein